ncbi:MAG: hypothetical protein WKG07_14705 [Hymenobacter sp.]
MVFWGPLAWTIIFRSGVCNRYHPAGSPGDVPAQRIALRARFTGNDPDALSQRPTPLDPEEVDAATPAGTGLRLAH